MTTSLKENFNKTWNADLVLDYIEFLADIKRHGLTSIEISKDDDYRTIIKNRLDSALRAYGRQWDLGGRGLMGKMSENKLNELFSIISDYKDKETSDKIISRIIEAQKFFNSYEDENLDSNSFLCVGYFFRYLLFLYVSLRRLTDPFSNLIECCKEVYESYSFISGSILSPQKELIDKIKKMLVLMMGDDFDKEISELELIEKFGYPQMTDDELFEMRIKQEL